MELTCSKVALVVKTGLAVVRFVQVADGDLGPSHKYLACLIWRKCTTSLDVCNLQIVNSRLLKLGYVEFMRKLVFSE